MLVKILNKLQSTGFGAWVNAAAQSNDGDPIRMVAGLLLTKIKPKVITARQKCVSGRNLFDTRMSGKPIKTLLAGYRKGRLQEAVKSLASPELYIKLFPRVLTDETNNQSLTLVIDDNL